MFLISNKKINKKNKLDKLNFYKTFFIIRCLKCTYSINLNLH